MKNKENMLETIENNAEEIFSTCWNMSKNDNIEKDRDGCRVIN